MKKIAAIILWILLSSTTFNSYAQKRTELLIQANTATLERKFDKAIDLYGQYIALNPNDFRGYFNRGTTAFNAIKYPLAIADFTKTLDLNPIFMEAYYFRGQAFFHTKNYDKAIADFTQGLEKKPNNPAFLKLRAESYAAKDNNDAALTDLNTAIHYEKLSGDLYKRRAELKVKLNDIDGGIKDYSAVEKLIPTYKMVHFIKGKLYLELNEIAFACDSFEEALKHNIVVADQLYAKYCTQP
jgi:tetratricopeptide (TPR) repeat protein